MQLNICNFWFILINEKRDVSKIRRTSETSINNHILEYLAIVVQKPWRTNHNNLQMGDGGERGYNKKHLTFCVGDRSGCAAVKW